MQMSVFLFLYQLMFIASNTLVGAAIAFYITSIFVVKGSATNEIFTTEIEDPPTNFEEMYKDEFEKLELKDLPDEDILTTLSSHVETPLGVVVVNYDSTEKCYNYYTDSRNIPDRFLNTVARKFVIDHDCLKLYEEEKSLPKSAPSQQDDPSTPHPATAQTYYQWISNMLFTRKTATDEVTDTEVPHEPEESIVDSEDDVPEAEGEEERNDEPKSVFANYKKKTTIKNDSYHEKVMNKYHYQGSLLDYEQRQTKKTTDALEISFLKYKELIKNKTA